MPLPADQLSTALRKLQAIAFDVDGVLTDGMLTWSPLGKEYKTFSFTDIMGISLLRRLGIKMALVSGERSAHVDRYAEKMHIQHVIKGTRDKAGALRNFAGKQNLSLARTCYFGDDINDLFAMELAGLCACPANAAQEVLDYVEPRGFVSQRNGGHGAVRELTDAILAARKVTGREVFLMRPPDEH